MLLLGINRKTVPSIDDEELYQKIEKYIKENDLDKIKSAIEKKPNYKELDYNKKLLITAIQCSTNNVLIEYFIDKSDNLNYEIIQGKTPIGEALNKHNFYISDILLKKGANINYINSRNFNILFYLNDSKDKPLNSEVLKYLSKNDVNFNWKNRQNKSFIDYMIEEGNEKILKLVLKSFIFNNKLIVELISYSKSKKGISKEEFNKLINKEYKKLKINDDILNDNVIRKNNIVLLNILLQYIFDKERLNNMLHRVCREKNIEMLKILLEKGADVNCKEKNTLITPLMDISFIDKGLKKKGLNQCIFDMFEILINSGADIDERDIDGKTALMYILSTKKASLKLIKFLVQQGAEINDICKNGCSPLIYACKGNNKFVIKYLINSGANTNIVSNDGKSLLIHAAMNGCIYLVQYLFENNMVDNIDCTDDMMETPLMYAIKSNNFDLIKYLVEKKADLNVTNINDVSVLNMACCRRMNKKKIAIAQYLIEHGADVNKSFNNIYQKVALNFAIDFGNIELVKVLVENGADVNCKNDDNKTPLYYSMFCEKNNKITEYLLDNGAFVNEIIGDNNETVLFTAVKYSKIDIIRLLVDNGADVNHKNKDNNIPLGTVLNKAKDRELIEMLLNDDVDFEELNKDNGRSLFHNCILTENTSLFNYIMENEDIELNINHKDSCHNTPLILAASVGNLDFVSKILERKPNVNLKNDRFETALFWAVERNNYKIMKLLIEHGAEIDNSNVEINKQMLFSSICSFRNVQLLIKNGFRVNNYIINSPNNRGEFLLSLAIRKGKFLSVQFLLENGANPYLNNKLDQIPLHVISSLTGKTKVESAIKFIECFIDKNINLDEKNIRGETLLYKLISYYDINYKRKLMKYLIEEKKVDVNIQTNEGISILMLAVDKTVQFNLEDIIYLVKDHENLIDMKDNYGNTALSYALNKGDPAIYNYLLDKCQDFTFKNNNGVNLLMCAVRNVDLSVVKRLIKNGISINDIDNEGRNALFYICGNIECVPKAVNCILLGLRNIIPQLRDIFKYLVEEGIDINCVDKNGKNILFYINDYELMKYSIEHGANINQIDNNGQTILFEMSNFEMMKYVIEHGADASIRDHNGHTAVYEKKRPDINMINYLVDHGADIKEFKFSCVNSFAFNYNFHTEFINKALDLGLRFDIENIEDKEGDKEGNVKETFLDYYIEYFYKFETEVFIQIFKKAINKKLFDINRKNFQGDTPLLFFIKKLNNQLLKEKRLYYGLLLFMVDHGAHLDEVDNEGKTALYYAMEFSIYLTKKFYSRGARILIQNGHNKSIINVKNILLHESSSDAIKCNIIQFLKSTLNIDFKKKVDDIYPIFLAIEQKCYLVVKYLLSEKVLLKYKNSKNETIMEVAQRIGDRSIINIISEQVECEVKKEKSDKDNNGNRLKYKKNNLFKSIGNKIIF